MCLAIPGRVIELYEEDAVTMARVDFEGIKRSVCLQYVPQAQVGQYVLVHVGFALNLIDEAEAKRGLALLQSSGQLAEELKAL
jgi:hydrogenase expression/formation protein HypC